MTISDAESRLAITLPDRHRQAMLDPTDPIQEECDFLIPESPHELLRWVEVNEFLHRADRWNSWPPFLVAFASNGCGDYSAYDTRTAPYRIYYIGPEHTVPEAIAACEEEGFVFHSFEEWYRHSVSRDDGPSTTR